MHTTWRWPLAGTAEANCRQESLILHFTQALYLHVRTKLHLQSVLVSRVIRGSLPLNIFEVFLLGKKNFYTDKRTSVY